MVYSEISIKWTHYKADTSIRRTLWRGRIALLCDQTFLEKISIKQTFFFLYQWRPLYRDSTVFAIYGCKCKIPCPLRNGWSQLLSWNKETLYSEKSDSLQLNIFFLNQLLYFGSQSFLWAFIIHWDFCTSVSNYSSLLFRRL